MKKIFIMTSVHRWDDPRIFYRQARTLARCHHVELHAPGCTGRVEVDGVRVKGLPPAGRLARPLQWFRLLWRALRSRADYFHLHDPELLPVGVIIKTITRKPVIYDAHEDYSLTLRHREWLPACLRNPAARLFGWLEKRLARCLDAVVAATPDIARRGAFTPPTVVVRNYPPFDTSTVTPAGDFLPADSRFTAVYVGGISTARGIDDLLAALDLLKGVRLVLAGHFFDRRVEHRVLERAAAGGDLLYLGRLSPSSVPGLLRASSAGLACLHPLPNHVRSLPLKLFEYMAAGLPVVASNFPLWEEIVTANGCGLTVPPGDCRAIAAALQTLAGNPDLGRQMGANARRAWLTRYNWLREAEKLLALYRTLDAGKGIVDKNSLSNQ